MNPYAYGPRLGALPEAGGVHFRVWAPAWDRVDVRVEVARGLETDPDATAHTLARGESGYFEGFVPGLGGGTRYRYVLGDGQAYPDPASRSQPEGVHGPSEVLDALAFRWTDEAWRGIALEDVITYELHIGTFTPEGTYAAAAEALPALVELGVTAVQIMPLASFAGTRGWGYDGVQPFAPTSNYGTPDDLRALVNRAHALGLAVILDVVYNHFGPDGAYQGVYGPQYFNQRHNTPWGPAINLDGPDAAEVRAYFIESALHWLHEYHVDGFRLDATNTLIDESPRHFLAEYAERIHEASLGGKRPLVIAEDSRNFAPLLHAPPEGYGFDEVLADDFHHDMRRLLAGDDEGYYADYRGAAADIATELERGWLFTGQSSAFWDGPRGTDPQGIALPHFSHCVQNHDQVGNRAFGERLHHEVPLEAYRAASALLLTSTETPMLFMGQEWAASSPFLFFSDHHKELGQRVTAGRREEFKAWSAFAGEAARERIPDPQAPETFERSRLDWVEREREPHASTLRLYQALLRLRHREPLLRWAEGDTQRAAALDDHTVELRRERDGDAIVVVARLRGAGTLAVDPPGGLEAGTWQLLLTTEDEGFAPEATPIELDYEGGQLSLRFERPGAVVLRAVAR